MWPFEGNHYADVAPGENEFDTPGLQHSFETQYVCVCADSLADYYPVPVYRRFDLDLAVLHHSVCLGHE